MYLRSTNSEVNELSYSLNFATLITMQVRYFLKKFDWALVAIPAILIGLSIATFYHLGTSSAHIIQRQILFFTIGLIAMAIVSLFDYRIFKNYSTASVAIYLFTILLLLIALGAAKIRGVNSWLYIGNYGFEPSELANLAVIILLAKYFSQKHVSIYDIRHIVASGIYALVPAFLTFIQPDLGGAAIIIFIWATMLLASGIKRKHFMVIVAIGLIVMSLGWFLFLKPYQKTRITTFLNPYLDPRGEGYSIIQAKTTVGSGQLWGSMISRTTSAYPVLVPEPYTDFTFSVFAQKFGFWGVILVYGLLLALVYRISVIANSANNNFAKLFSLGFCILIVAHVLVNSGMNIGLLPITGLPFSFLSYGGSHLITLMIGLGIIESVRLHG